MTMDHCPTGPDPIASERKRHHEAPRTRCTVPPGNPVNQFFTTKCGERECAVFSPQADHILAKVVSRQDHSRTLLSSAAPCWSTSEVYPGSLGHIMLHISEAMEAVRGAVV